MTRKNRRSGKKISNSRYGRKIKEWKQGIFSESSIYYNPNKPSYNITQNKILPITQQRLKNRPPSEYFSSKRLQVSIVTSYIQNGQNAIVMRTQPSHTRQVYSILTRLNPNSDYTHMVKMHKRNGGNLIVEEDFGQLFNNSEIVKNRRAQLEIRAAQEALEIQDANISYHLKSEHEKTG